jgi:hypothetical protein
MSRLLLLIVLACATLGLVACGGDKKETVTVGESEAVYVTLGDLQYQVQLSRQLDRFAPGDRDLLKGVPAAERKLAPDEIWFGVWFRAQNGTDGAQPTADEFRIKDTTGREFKPVQLDETSPFAYRSVSLEGGAVYPLPGSASGQSATTDETSPFAYRSVSLEGGAVYPLPGSASGQSATTGGFLLFRMPVSALDFRPLEFEFASSELPGKVSAVRLDV